MVSGSGCENLIFSLLDGSVSAVERGIKQNKWQGQKCIQILQLCSVVVLTFDFLVTLAGNFDLTLE